MPERHFSIFLQSIWICPTCPCLSHPLAVSTSILFPFFLPLSVPSLVSSVPFLRVLMYPIPLNHIHHHFLLPPKYILQSIYIQSHYTEVFMHTSPIAYIILGKNVYTCIYSSQAKGSQITTALISFRAVVSFKRNEEDE